jgi:hypothetical protein
MILERVGVKQDCLGQVSLEDWIVKGGKWKQDWKCELQAQCYASRWTQEETGDAELFRRKNF